MLWRVIQTKVAKAKSDFMKQRINRNVYIWVRFWHQENRQLKRYKSECRELDTYFMSEDELIQAKERQKITKARNKAIVQRAYMIAMATN